MSTPAEQGLDPMLAAELYYSATKLPRLYGLLVVKNGCLIAEMGNLRAAPEPKWPNLCKGAS